MPKALFAAAILMFGMVQSTSAAPFLLIELKSGNVKIEMLPDVAPKHVEQITTLANQGVYDGIAFHRVIEGFMAQTGDVQYGKVQDDGSISRRAGTGDSKLPNIPAEFSDLPFDRGVVGMARTNDPNSANSQFFIMFEKGHSLNGKYTVWGRVVEGIEHVDNIQLGHPETGKTNKPDRMIKVTVVDE